MVWATFFAAVWALIDRSKLTAPARFGPSAAIIILGAMTVALVIWVVKAPLLEQRAVPLPPPSASPQVVVRSFVAALDEHDAATAYALCAPRFLDVGCSSDVGYFINLRITGIGSPLPDANDGFSPKG